MGEATSSAWAERLPKSASGVLSGPEMELLRELLDFLEQRLEGAAAERAGIEELLKGEPRPRAVQAALHRFLRDAWDALDGLGRVVNVCLHRRFPDAGLWPPQSMTRQCTFYTAVSYTHLRAHET